MKFKKELSITIAFMLALLLSAAAPFQGQQCGNVVMGGVCSLNEGETLEGGMVLMGGSARLEDNSKINGDVVILGGSLESEATIEGDVVIIGGLVDLGEAAVIEGDIVAIGGYLHPSEGAVIEGDIFDDISNLFPLIISGHTPELKVLPGIITPGSVRTPRLNFNFNPIWEGLWLLLRSFLWAILAVLVVLFLPKNIQRTAGAAVTQPAASGALGCLTALTAPLLIVIMAITICGIPLSVISVILLLITWALGVIALGTEVGNRLSNLFNRDWAMAVSAGVGTLALTLVSNGIAAFLPSCIGWMAPTLVGVVGIGAVLLTRFGTQGYPPQAKSSISTQITDIQNLDETSGIESNRSEWLDESKGENQDQT